jgi:dihydrofolate reductase
MRKIINQTNISLDGVIEMPQEWSILDEELNETSAGHLRRAGAVLLGRETYVGLAGYWPTADGELAELINAIPKYVVSTTIEPDQATWGETTIIDSDPIETLARIRDEDDGGDLLMYGFGPLARDLLAHDLLDELVLYIQPALAGVGGPDDLLFRPGNSAKLTLASTDVQKSGVIVATYHPGRS